MDSRSNSVSTDSANLPDMNVSVSNEPPRGSIPPKVLNPEAERRKNAYIQFLPRNKAWERKVRLETGVPKRVVPVDEEPRDPRKLPAYGDPEDERAVAYLVAGRSRPGKPVPLPRVHPSVTFDIAEWVEWGRCGAHPDFPEYPPLLQFNDIFHSGMKDWMCRICDFPCPPPYYACGNGHILCFSCASLQLGSMCPIWPRFLEDGDGSRCGLPLVPCDLLLKIWAGYNTQPTRNTYPCPFQKFGCVEKDLLPNDVVEHAQKDCKFRYTLRCFDDTCFGSRHDIRVGSFLAHLQNFHAPRVVNLDAFRVQNDPLCIEYYPISPKISSSFSIPITFDGCSGFELSLVMKRENKSVYFWIYKVIDKGQREPTTIQAELCLKNKNSDGENLSVNNVIIPSTFLNQEVIESGRCIQMSQLRMEDEFLFTLFPTPKSFKEKEKPIHEEIKFFIINVSFTEKQESVVAVVSDNPSM